MSPVGTDAISYYALAVLPVRATWKETWMVVVVFPVAWDASNCGSAGTMESPAHLKRRWWVESLYEQVSE